MRLFVGIPLPAEVVGELSAVVGRVGRSKDGLRWAAPESWHITLQFLGECSAEAHGCLAARLGEIASPQIPVRLGELGFFDHAEIFYAGVEVTPELVSLQQRVTAATSLCGFVPESRPFHPHITLARAKGEGSRARGFVELKGKVQHQPTFSRFVAGEFLLYESFLGPGGSWYEVRERFGRVSR